MSDKQYKSMIQHILDNGEDRPDRTGVGTRSVFGWQNRYNLNDGFPVLTTKRIHFKSVVGELLWMLSGSTDVKELRDKYGVTIWDEWELEDGTIGDGYGFLWRKWSWNEPVDQIADVVKAIALDPYSRRHVVSAWNPVYTDSAALPPCHTMFQFYISTDDRLSCHLYQRSQDCGLGNPFNVAQYALLTHLIAHVTGLGVGDFVHSMGDAHIYQNHIEPLKEQIKREPYPLPKLWINPDIRCISDFSPEDIKLLGYQYHKTVKMEVAV